MIAVVRRRGRQASFTLLRLVKLSSSHQYVEAKLSMKTPMRCNTLAKGVETSKGVGFFRHDEFMAAD